MKLKVKLVLFVALYSTLSFASFIDNGFKASDNQFPAILKLSTYSYDYRMEFEESSCTAVAITPNFIITALHCVEFNSELRQRVSLPGDSAGDTDRFFYGLLPGGGIRTKKSYVAGETVQVLNSLSEIDYVLYKFMRVESTGGELNDRNKGKKAKALDIRNDLMDKLASNDIAIISLEEPLELKSFPKLSCKKLKVGDEVLMAGYGTNFVKGSTKDYNIEGELFYGFNKITNVEMGYYSILSNSKQQIVNAGDSGGAVYLKNDPNTIYGINSLRARGHVARLTKNGIKISKAVLGSIHSLASRNTINFLKNIAADPNTPQELIDAFGDCVD